jgi:hypothetical protein
MISPMVLRNCSRSCGAFAQYQVKTDRELPIIRLVSRSAPEAPQE